MITSQSLCRVNGGPSSKPWRAAKQNEIQYMNAIIDLIPNNLNNGLFQPFETQSDIKFSDQLQNSFWLSQDAALDRRITLVKCESKGASNNRKRKHTHIQINCISLPTILALNNLLRLAFHPLKQRNKGPEEKDKEETDFLCKHTMQRFSCLRVLIFTTYIQIRKVKIRKLCNWEIPSSNLFTSSWKVSPKAEVCCSLVILASGYSARTFEIN